tara:strand:- start:1518 stop:2420 length:903 start_codon:yes stop_codon:yes gene_type:complete
LPARRKIEGSPEVTYQVADAGKPKVAARIVQKTWDPKDARATCKVFHHIFAPDGTLLTKGLGGTFEHHRGLFIGWNKTKFDGKTYDFWHLNKGESQRFRGHGTPAFLAMGEGAQISLIDWCDPAGKIVVRELRGLEVLEQHDDFYVLHVRSKCMTVAKDVILSGDPQHAGQQFRALQQFAEENARPVVYVRPEGAKDEGNDIWTNCNWMAGVLELEKASYTVLQIDGLGNPDNSKWSTRPYGRFGVTRKATVRKGQPVILNQFFVVANGKRDAAWCAEQAAKLRPASSKKATKLLAPKKG